MTQNTEKWGFLKLFWVTIIIIEWCLRQYLQKILPINFVEQRATFNLRYPFSSVWNCHRFTTNKQLRNIFLIEFSRKQP